MIFYNLEREKNKKLIFFFFCGEGRRIEKM